MKGMPPPKRSYRWVWYFVVLGVLTTAACTTLVWYNLRQQQLKLEDLVAARYQWLQRRPANHDLTYTKRGSATGTFLVQGSATGAFLGKVRNGEVVSVTLDGREITQNVRPLHPSRHFHYDMTGLMVGIELSLTEDAKPGRPRTYTVATFDLVDGHLVRYVRRVMDTGERIEINVQLKKLSNARRKSG